MIYVQPGGIYNRVSTEECNFKVTHRLLDSVSRLADHQIRVKSWLPR
jgi:hypothetical protein